MDDARTMSLEQVQAELATFPPDLQDLARWQITERLFWMGPWHNFVLPQSEAVHQMERLSELRAREWVLQQAKGIYIL